MKTQAGMWIDHREANIVFLSQGGEETKQISSNVEKQLRRSGASASDEPFEARRVPASDRREKAYMGHLSNYYEEIVSATRGAESIFIFGPGEAKGELRKHFHKHNLCGLIVGFETADKMSKRQVTAKVRDFYVAAPTIPLTMEDQLGRLTNFFADYEIVLLFRSHRFCTRCACTGDPASDRKSANRNQCDRFKIRR